MASVHLANGTAGGFSVYCGNGRYVSAISISSRHAAAHVGHVGEAARMDRAGAVAACHTARRVGVPAWVVKAPAL